ncbi:MAG: hypothetical protein GXY83_27310 [Rhodopirellula sp.]|nr:hypothetical protein [Rhodopirellula sp.]
MNVEQREALLGAVHGIVRALGADFGPDLKHGGQQDLLGLSFILAQLVDSRYIRGEGRDGHPWTAHDKLNLLYRLTLDHLPEDD